VKKALPEAKLVIVKKAGHATKEKPMFYALKKAIASLV
jgi:hypothetical protein